MSSKPSCHQPSTASQYPRLASAVAAIPWVDNSSHSARLALAVFKLGHVCNDLGNHQGSRTVLTCVDGLILKLYGDLPS